MYPMTATIDKVAKFLWPGRHNVGLATALAVPLPTAKAWIAGTRRMPAGKMERFALFLRQRAAATASLAQEVEFDIRQERRRPRRLRGFFEMRDRDGSGVLRNVRWRGGRRKPPAEP